LNGLNAGYSSRNPFLYQQQQVQPNPWQGAVDNASVSGVGGGQSAAVSSPFANLYTPPVTQAPQTAGVGLQPESINPFAFTATSDVSSPRMDLGGQNYAPAGPGWGLQDPYQRVAAANGLVGQQILFQA
jgi:hypothetical protein